MHDNEIIALFFRRDERALKEAADKYGELCKSVSMRILNDSRDAEECVSDAYLAAWNRIPPEKPRSLGAFLCRIARNISVSRLRKDTAEKRGGGEGTLLLEELDECLSEQSAEERYIESETVSAINRFLKKLPGKQRDIFVLRYYHAYSVSRISEMTGYEENNVRAILSNVRKKLKEYLSKEGLL